MRLNQGRIGNIQTTKAISDILETNPNVEFRLDCPNVTEVEVADHLNGGLNGYDNTPLFSLNSIYQKTQYVDVALVQCFFGQDALQENAIELALQFMSMSNPRPREWVFVEAQRSEMDAKFKWVVGLGCKYVFVKVQNDKQDYFIKEQLWNIGAKNTKSKRLVFVDADVAYCQMDWLAHVNRTFDEGVELFQPHAWSWRANESDGDKDKYANAIALTPSFGYHRSNGIHQDGFSGHTGYDIAISKKLYKSIGGFYSLKGTGGDYLMWSIFVYDDTMSWHPMKEVIKMIISQNSIPQNTKIGCTNLVCFHNYHGSAKNRAKKYDNDLNEQFQVANNFGMNRIAEVE